MILDPQKDVAAEKKLKTTKIYSRQYNKKFLLIHLCFYIAIGVKKCLFWYLLLRLSTSFTEMFSCNLIDCCFTKKVIKVENITFPLLLMSWCLKRKLQKLVSIGNFSQFEPQKCVPTNLAKKFAIKVPQKFHTTRFISARVQKPYLWPKWPKLIPYSWSKGLLCFGAAHTYIADMMEYPTGRIIVQCRSPPAPLQSN